MAKEKKWQFKRFESRNQSGKHIRIAEDMMNSKAWSELDSHEIHLYLSIKRKYNSFNEKNISFTYREGQALMSKKKFTSSMDSLIDVGLIDIVHHWPTAKKATIYGLSTRWHQYGTDNFEKKPRPKLKSPNKSGKMRTRKK